ncbi:MAG: glycerophosphodiester phosphodiesterase [bacterium]|nr:glycerophosphodiester phosphodiesterase [bacterium]
MSRAESVFERLRRACAASPVVVAHRGASRAHPENTLPAFVAARDLGCVMQEFDVRATADGELICIHDATFDRTTDSATALGPGALVASARGVEVRRLRPAVPTLADVLDAVLPGIPLIEHKAGPPAAYVDCLRAYGALERCILQSFDWRFVAAAKELAPELPVAVLGPTLGIDHLDATAIRHAIDLGAGMVHWRDRALNREAVDRAHAAGLLVCSYTTDDEIVMLGGRALGIDAMCTNVPDRMMRVLDGPRVRPDQAEPQGGRRRP